MERLIVALRAAMEVVGLLTIITMMVGGITLKIDGLRDLWTVFLSGGLWIGLPLTYAVRAYTRESLR